MKYHFCLIIILSIIVISIGAKSQIKIRETIKISSRLTNDSIQTHNEMPDVDTVLLGQSKYYYGVIENNEDGIPILSLKSTNQPVLPSDGQSSVYFDEPWDTAESEFLDTSIPYPERKSCVYWEYKFPNYLNGLFIGMGVLPSGMIRVVGRYWQEGKYYEIWLRARLGPPGEGQHVVKMRITIQKPKNLLTEGVSQPFTNSYNVYNNVTFNLDDTLIAYGGKYGIPPQFIKGHIKHEASISHPYEIYPTYVYEPYTAQLYHDNWTTWTRNDGSWYVDTERLNDKMGLAGAVPSHLNVQDFTYPTSPQTVWSMIVEHSQLVNPVVGWSHTKYGKRTGGKMDFYKYTLPTTKYKEYLTLGERLLKNNQDKYNYARERIIGYLRDELGFNKIIAQTRLASSYGVLQLMFETAAEQFYPSNDPQFRPEDLNDISVNMFYSLNYYKTLLNKSLKISKQTIYIYSDGVVVDEIELWNNNSEWGCWPLGFETTYNNEVFTRWNSKITDYGKIILGYSKLYDPNN